LISFFLKITVAYIPRELDYRHTSPKLFVIRQWSPLTLFIRRSL